MAENLKKSNTVSTEFHTSKQYESRLASHKKTRIILMASRTLKKSKSQNSVKMKGMKFLQLHALIN